MRAFVHVAVAALSHHVTAHALSRSSASRTIFQHVPAILPAAAAHVHFYHPCDGLLSPRQRHHRRRRSRLLLRHNRVLELLPESFFEKGGTIEGQGGWQEATGRCE